MDNKKVWIGLVTVTPHADNEDLNGAAGAVVNVLCWSSGKEEFCSIVTEKMFEFGFNINETEDVAPFMFSNKQQYKDNLGELANEVKKDKLLRWGTFYSYK